MSCEDTQLKECNSCKIGQPLCNYTKTKNKKGEVVPISRCRSCMKEVNRINRQKPEVKERKNYLRREKWKIPEERVKIKKRLEETKDNRLARRRENYQNLTQEKKEEILAKKRICNARIRQRPGYKEEYNKYKREWDKRKMKESPKFRMDHLMAKGMRKSMADNGIKKGGRSWEALAGYTVNDLIEHFQKYFDENIGWHNMKDWDIDHIIPKTAFFYDSPEDPQFKECWSLSNLRPLMRHENQKKNDKINGVSARKLKAEGKLPTRKLNGNQTVQGLPTDEATGPIQSGAQGQAHSTELLQGVRSSEVSGGQTEESGEKVG